MEAEAVSVYVDDLILQGWCLYGRHVKSCHLWADSVEELLRFAREVGLPRAWAQGIGERGKLPHFDLVASKRLLVIEAGARPVGRREAVRLFKRWRVGGSAFQEGKAPPCATTC